MTGKTNSLLRSGASFPVFNDVSGRFFTRHWKKMSNRAKDGYIKDNLDKLSKDLTALKLPKIEYGFDSRKGLLFLSYPVVEENQ